MLEIILTCFCFVFAGVTGFALAKMTGKQNEPRRPAPPAPGIQPACRNTPGKENQGWDSQPVRAWLEQIARLQTGGDLLERYQIFLRLVQNILQPVLGNCQISLWCPEENYESLVECRFSADAKSGSPTSSGPDSARTACRVPLENPEIQKSLRTGNPYLITPTRAEYPFVGQVHSPAFPCDACIPLFRDYGQPILIHVICPGLDVKRCRREEFLSAVNLIRLFWDQLQTANQRQWSAEHDEGSGALREEAFLFKAQSAAQRCYQRDEPFALAVITFRGFRNMFAGHAQQWRALAGILGRRIRSVLRETDTEFLLGKTADDVFVLMLPQKDEFLAQALLANLLTRLRDVLPEDKMLQSLDVTGLELQTAAADQKQYQGNLETLLNKIYRRLFCRADNRQNRIYTVSLRHAGQEVG